MVLLDVSSNDFLQKHNFDDLILYKRLYCEISFSYFVYLLLDRITHTSKITILEKFFKNSGEFRDIVEKIKTNFQNIIEKSSVNHRTISKDFTKI